MRICFFFFNYIKKKKGKKLNSTNNYKMKWGEIKEEKETHESGEKIGKTEMETVPKYP